MPAVLDAYTREELRKHFGWGYAKVQKFRETGKLPGHYDGQRLLFLREDVIGLIKTLPDTDSKVLARPTPTN